MVKKGAEGRTKGRGRCQAQAPRGPGPGHCLGAASTSYRRYDMEGVYGGDKNKPWGPITLGRSGEVQGQACCLLIWSLFQKPLLLAEGAGVVEGSRNCRAG